MTQMLNQLSTSTKMFLFAPLHNLLLLCAISCVHGSTLSLDPDETMSLGQLVTSRGYVLQEYHVLTDDGYILTVHRVVPKSFNAAIYNLGRKPVLAWHGILNDGACFYHNSPFVHVPDSCGDTFGFCMLNSGRYDLWVANARGNRYSRDHIRYTHKDPQFWEFSWDAIALIDIPAVIDLIRQVTRHRTLGYIGHSQGGATMFALLTRRPEYAHIVKPFIGWAPAVYLHNMKSPMKISLDAGAYVRNRLPGVYWPSLQVTNDLTQYGLCRGLAGNEFCSMLLQLLFGPSNSMNTTRVPMFMHHFPSMCSNYQMAQFGQARLSGRFRSLDYGSAERNLQAHGVPYPPEYKLRNISPHLKVVVMYGATDWLISEQDSRRLIAELRANGVPVIGHRVRKDVWNHMDFLGGFGAGRLVYEDTLRYLDAFAWN